MVCFASHIPALKNGEAGGTGHEADGIKREGRKRGTVSYKIAE